MFILLLGSYDSETKEALYSMQETIANSFAREGHYSLIMEVLDLYTLSDGHILLLENRDEHNTTIYLFNPREGNGPIEPETIDTISNEGDVENTVYEYLTKTGFCEADITTEKISILSSNGLFNFLVSISSVFMLLRLKEETRGGEYIELFYITRTGNWVSLEGFPKILILKKKGVTLTSMIDLILVEKEIPILEFTDIHDLLKKTVSIVKNFI
jgi:hypothetical protein